MGASESVWLDGDLAPLTECPVCLEPRLQVTYEGLIDLDEGVPGVWKMTSCKACRSLLLDPRPTPEALPKAYNSYYTHNTPDAENAAVDGRGFLSDMARCYLARRYNFGAAGGAWRVLIAKLAWPFRQQLDYYLRHIPARSGRLLDLGCGSGGFLVRASRCGWDVVGVEPDPVAAEVARKYSGLPVSSSLDDVDGAFDVITMAHVVEHLHDPKSVLKICHARLVPGGHLWIATPNISGFGHRLYKNAWQPLETPRHLMLPSPAALSKMLNDVGFTDVRFLRRGRGAAKRIQASNERSRVLGHPIWPVLPLATFIDLAASVSAYAGEELVVVAKRGA